MKDWIIDFLGRVANDPVYYAIRLTLIFVLFVVLTLVTGCASPRYLTEEQDQEMRATCEAQGCTVLSGKALEQIQKALKACGLNTI